MIAALWTKNRKVALAIAKEYTIPNLDREDVEQEAVVALWEAAYAYDPTREASFATFARVVVNRHLIDLLRAATAEKRTALFDRDVEVADKTDRLNARLALRDLLVAIEQRLSDRELWAVIDHLRGAPAHSNKAHNNALTRARRKLKEIEC